MGAALLLVVLATLPLARPARTSSSVTQEWAAHYNGPANNYDIAAAIAVDGSGNTYVTGYSLGESSGFDYATVKYDSAGSPVWTARYNGPQNSHDFAAALAVDGSGNVYVTGSSVGGGDKNDYATVKYDSGGNQVWAVRYNGPANDTDGATALAVDGGGNVYVTGNSFGGGATDYDYATVKYNSAGAEVWAARYNGPANSYDSANSLQIDGGGNVYVTGNSTGVGTQHDYATVKYNSAGAQVWAARYNGPTNSYDSTAGLAVDGSGNVYVTGSSSSDYATVKYDGSGNQVWVTRYNGPANGIDTAKALAADGSGNVYVTGASPGTDTGNDYATVKYDGGGNQVWAARYHGPTSDSDDQATALKVDGAGNVYVTGNSTGIGVGSDYETVRYNSGGSLVWATRYNGAANDTDGAVALAVDGGGNVYVTGYSSGTDSYDYATFKYSQSTVTSPAANQLWSALFDGPANNYDIPVAIAVDGNGNTYVTGYSLGVDSGFDYATVKYGSAGNKLWAVRYNGPANSHDFAAALAVDGSGNVYVTGSSSGSDDKNDYATVKYNSGGNQVWAVRYNGPGNDSDGAVALAVDGSGNVYVTGNSYGGGATDYDYATVKYNSAGAEVWAARYNGPANSYDIANSLQIDGGGNVYVTGNSTGIGTQHDYATVKYNSAGAEVWAARYNGPTNSYDSTAGLAVDGSGNVYVTGSSSSDYATVKYDGSGNQVWVTRYNGPANGVDTAKALAVDGSGNTYVTGASPGVSTGNDYATVKYDSGGNQVWAARYHGPASDSDDQATALKVDGAGNVYVTGNSTGIGVGSDYETAKYDSGGYLVWTTRYNGAANDTDGATALAVDGSGNAYVTGYSTVTNGYDYATVKYGPPPPDTTPPAGLVGSVVVESASRVYIPITVSDSGSGVAQVKLTANSTNAKLEWVGPSGLITAPINSPLVISPASAGTLVRVVKLNVAQKARVEVLITDAAGNTALIDPVIANLEIKQRPLERTFGRIPQAERYVTLQNGTPGLTQARLWVNGRVVSQGDLADGQVVSLDVARWLRPGKRNTVRIAARGPKGATAVLTIGDVMPTGASSVSAAGAAVNLEFAP